VTGAGGFSGSLASIEVSGGPPEYLTAGSLLGQVAIIGPFVVTNTNDSGIGSLRQAILNANANPGLDTIDFAPGLSGTIVLTSGELQITNDVTIDGPGADPLSVSGNNASRVFEVDAGTTAAISGLTITGGSADQGGGLDNSGALTVSNSVFSSNSANTGFGGGLYNEPGGTLTVSGSTFTATPPTTAAASTTAVRRW
jgi:hypothetical protein